VPHAGRLAVAVAVGLLVGKVLGIAGVTLLTRRLRLGTLPTGVTTRYVWGLAALAGIGFTVSLFIADLAYRQAALTDAAKIGILAGSLAAALLGTAILFPGRHPRPSSRHGTETESVGRTQAPDQA
jgi:Na+:H+ antiporter, NhaA family